MHPTLSDRLRRATAGVHRTAQSGVFVNGLLNGRLSRLEWLCYLATMTAIHRAMAQSIPTTAWGRELQQALPLRDRVEDLSADLRLLTDAGTLPLPALPIAARRFLHWLNEEACSSALLGTFYVFEGSANGNRMIVEALSQQGAGYGSESRYLNGDGERVGLVWQTLRRWIDERDLSAEQAKTVELGALTAFRAMIAIYEELGNHGDHSALCDESRATA